MKTKIASLILFGCAALSAQPAFDAASIRTNNDADRPGSSTAQLTPSTFTMHNEALVYLIQWAYDIPRVEIEGPPWLREVWFDVQAKTSKPSTEPEMRLMLRKLLEVRFGLKFHKEARVLPAYALTLAKSGSKLQESTTEGTFAIEPRNGPLFVAHHARLVDLANGLADEAGRPVIDATGLQGRYEIRMDLTPYLRRAGEGQGPMDSESILFTGLQEVLGLKLEPR
ncbi:MAG TPA: TIGR03435 family protein, partial [Bryobacteraceae bacterium]